MFSNSVVLRVAIVCTAIACTACKSKRDDQPAASSGASSASDSPPPLPKRLAPAPGTTPSLRNTHGVTLGDMTATRAIVWARSDQQARMHVRLDSEGLRALARNTIVDADRDFTGRVALENLTPGTLYHYTVWFTAFDGPKHRVLPYETKDHPRVLRGSFRTAPSADQPVPVRFAWGGDVAGQNVCRDRERGFPIVEHMRQMKLDFFIALGDMVYADNACEETGKYGNRQVPGAPVSTTIEQYWDNWKYAREDKSFRALLGSVPTFAVWDDHEIVNDAGPAHDTRDQPPYQRGVHLLPLGLRSFLDYNALPKAGLHGKRLYRSARFGKHVELFFLDTRQYRHANARVDTDADPKSMLGTAQRTWLENGLKGSNATWKVVVSSVPMSIPTGAYPPEAGRDGWANFDQETGFERELIGILRTLQGAGVNRTLWLTTDVHFASGFRYRPFADDPSFEVHEWVSGPMNAGLYPKQEYDKTLNPTRTFFHGPQDADAVKDYQQALAWMNVGRIDVDAAGVLKVSIVNALGKTVHETTLSP